MIKGIYPYLVTNGNGQEAVKFYERALNAKVLGLQTFGDMPDNPEHPTPEEAKNRVMNAHLKVGDTDLMLSDTFPGMPYQTGDQVTIALITDDIATSKEIFENLREGGNVIMEMQETFWSPSYGQIKDKYGVTWQISAM
ncbi:VOC family protein [Fictibacillus fluitans]|uniref:VOC family protein n=1 Tax=Fictibacillus fluitans TaxID=3058422 RepID=A0ABT8HYZ2_9BACL|nr:VOC family protein [Fictibacillus sp. NE201]MDN4526000.1 VOC family protein [Fictibacillus sp. NE201]